jgi:hypothetical protein
VTFPHLENGHSAFQTVKQSWTVIRRWISPFAMRDTPLVLPELHAGDLTPAILKDAIRQRGAIIVREMLSAEDVCDLDAAFQQAIAAEAAYRSGLAAPSEWFTPYEDEGGDGGLPWTRQWLRDVDCVLMADSPAMLGRVGRAYHQAGILKLATAYLGEPPVLSSQKSTLRRTIGNKVYTDNWHQDGAFLGPGTHVINIWLALTPCGERAASVEIGTTRQTGIVPTGGEGAIFDWSVSPKEAALASPCSVTLVCAPGDAVLFDHLCLHRTSISGAYCEDRRALETWLFAPSTYPSAFDARPIYLSP